MNLMKQSHSRMSALLALSMLFASILTVAPTTSAGAQTPTCSSPAADSDGNGWGWENGASCTVVAQANSNNSSATCVDPDGDGWGWDGSASCRVIDAVRSLDTPSNVQVVARLPQNQIAIGWDPVDGADGYVLYRDGNVVTRTSATSTNVGSSNVPITVKAHASNQTVWSTASTSIRTQDEVAIANTEKDPNGTPYCRSASSDDNNDGWGWENNTSCLVRATASDQPGTGEEALNDVTVIANYKESDGRQVVVSQTKTGDLRLVTVEADGQVEVRQIAEERDTSYMWRFRLSDVHFELRQAQNINLPPSLRDARESDEWIELDYSQSIFHQDTNTPGPEIKFIHPDGREAVYYNHGPLSTDPAIEGSYNWVTPKPWPEEGAAIEEWLEFIDAGIGHTVWDVVPWLPGGYFTWLPGGSVRGPDPEPNGPYVPDESDLDNRDDDDDGVPAGQDLDDKDPNRLARPGTPLADDDNDGVNNLNDDYPDESWRHNTNDRDGDGVPNEDDYYPDDETKSVRVGGADETTVTPPPPPTTPPCSNHPMGGCAKQATHDVNGRPYCESSSSDPDGDGWGWENNTSCVTR